MFAKNYWVLTEWHVFSFGDNFFELRFSSNFLHASSKYINIESLVTPLLISRGPPHIHRISSPSQVGLMSALSYFSILFLAYELSFEKTLQSSSNYPYLKVLKMQNDTLTQYVLGGGAYLPTLTQTPNFLKIPLYKPILRFVDFLFMSITVLLQKTSLKYRIIS